MKKKLNVSVELPQPIRLNQDDSIELYLPDSGGGVITVKGNGIVHWHGNGGGAAVFALNFAELAQQVRANLH